MTESKIKHSSARLDEIVTKIGDEFGEIEQRRMFGHPALYCEGKLFLLLDGNEIVLRLPEADRSDLIQHRFAIPFIPHGRKMNEYVVLSTRLVEDRRKLVANLKKSVRFVKSKEK